MINSEQTIPCPTCQNKVHFNTEQLLMGTQFVCSNCQAAIGLALESKSIVKEAWGKFEAAKGKAS